MNANQLIKSVLYGNAALLTMGFALFSFGNHLPKATVFSVLSLCMVYAAWRHPIFWKQLPWRTSVLLLLHAAVLAVIAWQLYRQGYHKATFVYEGISIFYFSLAAFLFLLRKKRAVFFAEEEQ
jgi:hypothetical protein